MDSIDLAQARKRELANTVEQSLLIVTSLMGASPTTIRTIVPKELRPNFPTDGSDSYGIADKLADTNYVLDELRIMADHLVSAKQCLIRMGLINEEEKQSVNEIRIRAGAEILQGMETEVSEDSD